MPRTIAIGDIHGCAQALSALVAAIQPTPEDLLIPLGDMIDRGPDSKEVVSQLIALARTTRLAPILGNHEEMLLAAGRVGEGPELEFWLQCGGKATIDSYGDTIDDVPFDHIQFLSHCRPWYETATHFFVHASYLPDVPLDRQPPYQLRWSSLYESQPEAHISGKIAVVGHTAQRAGLPLDLGHLKCIDTYCYGGGWLTALDVESGQMWQANQQGAVR